MRQVVSRSKSVAYQRGQDNWRNPNTTIARYMLILFYHFFQSTIFCVSNFYLKFIQLCFVPEICLFLVLFLADKLPHKLVSIVRAASRIKYTVKLVYKDYPGVEDKMWSLYLGGLYMKIP